MVSLSDGVVGLELAGIAALRASVARSGVRSMVSLGADSGHMHINLFLK